jgi:hypothetical protein
METNRISLLHSGRISVCFDSNIATAYIYASREVRRGGGGEGGDIELSLSLGL